MAQYTSYLDESGEEGFSFKREPQLGGSSEWFVLSCVTHDTSHIPAIQEHYSQFTARHKKQDTWHFHFRTASHDERIAFIDHMAQLPYTAMAVAIHKPSLTKTENFQRPYFMYFYAAKLLFERLSWFLRQSGQATRLILSSRRGLTKDDFDSYLRLLKHSGGPISPPTNHTIDWQSIDTNGTRITANKELRGLQLADAVASGVAKAIEYSQYGTTEHRYLKSLKPMLFKQRGTYLAYGVKIFPRLTQDMLAQPRFHWTTKL